MGLAQRVDFESGRFPDWQAVADLLAGKQYPVQVRMIDGELSLPEELPSGTWQELRVGTPAGMVTIRREEAGVQFVIWGNAAPALQQASNALAWAFAERGSGIVETADGCLRPTEFARKAELPPLLKTAT